MATMDDPEDLDRPIYTWSGSGTDSVYSEEEEEDDIELKSYDLKAQFRAASAAIVKSDGDFEISEVLYDFLYKFREVANQTDADSGSLLHVAVETVREHPGLKTVNMKPLIQSLLKDHPHLLSAINDRGQTALYIAIWMRKYHLVEAMTDGCTNQPEWESALRSAMEIACIPERKTCLHAAFERDLRAKCIETLIRFSSNMTFATQDDTGKTPLHYAVDFAQCTEARIKLVDLCTARDEGMVARRGSEHTFLDIVDFKGNSVYMQNLKSRSSKLEELNRRKKDPWFHKQGKKAGYEESRQKESADPKMSEDSKTDQVESEDLGSWRIESQTVDVPGKVTAESAESLGLATEKSPSASTRSIQNPQPKDTENEKRPGKKSRASRVETNHPDILNRFSEILRRRLKLHYMRTRNSEMVLSFLYGKNLDGQRHLCVSSRRHQLTRL
jgi:hypothetical protein